MSVSISPIFNGWQGFTIAGIPMSGGLVNTYLAGTTTPAGTYTSSTGLVLNANPIQLDAAGLPPNEIWLTDGTVYKFVVTDSLGLNPRTYDNIAGGAAGSVSTSLAASSGSSLVGFIQAGAGATARTLQAKCRDAFSVKDFGAVGDGVTNDAAAIQLAIAATAALDATLYFPAGTYIVTPATAQVGANSYNTALVILSNLHCVGEKGATLKVSNNYSTDASPKEYAIFSTTVGLSNVSFQGLTFDLNGANNKISPLRPVTYSRFDTAAIKVSGTNAYINDVTIDNCVFKNAPGVCTIVCGEQSSAVTSVLGDRWNITGCVFINNGLDSDDFTAIYGWVNTLLVDGNVFWSDTAPDTAGKTGSSTAFETHGSRHRCVNNTVYLYRNGFYIAGNFSGISQDIVVANNTFYTTTWGGIFYRDQYMGEVRNVEVFGNVFYMDDLTAPGAGRTAKTGLLFEGTSSSAQQAINDVRVKNNSFLKGGGTYSSQCFRWETPTTIAAQVCSNIEFSGNTAIGFVVGANLLTNATNGQGYTNISRNKFINLITAGGDPVFGIYCNPVGGVSTLTIDNNEFINELGGAYFTTGARIDSGTITDFYYGRQIFKGVTTNDAMTLPTVTNWLGAPRAGKATITYSASMTPDASAAPVQVITVTSAAAMTINAPTRPTLGSSFTLQIKNSSGGAMGVITWNAIYARSAWTNPANGQNRSIAFFYDGTFWVQSSQTGVDVPN